MLAPVVSTLVPWSHSLAGRGGAFNLFPIKDKSDESPNSLISCLMASDICTGAADRRLNADQCDR